MRRTALVMMTMALVGCASYRAGLLPSKDVMVYDNREDRNGVVVAMDILDTKETEQIFQFDLQSKGVQPVYIVIDNRCSQTIEFNKSGINKNCLSWQQVAEKCKFNTAARATTWGVAGLFLWPLLIPAVVDGVGSSNANKSMEQDFQYKEMPDKVRVQPNGLQTGIVFVPAMKPGEDFVMRLTNVESGEILLFSSRKP